MYSSPRFYYVYIMTNRSKTLYTGVTGNLERRIFEQKQGIKGEFAARYKIDPLVSFEPFSDIHAAIAREKQIKGLLRIKKIALIVSMNPEWKDLSEVWHVRHQYQPENALILRREPFAKRKTPSLRMTTLPTTYKTAVILSAVCRSRSKRQQAKDLCTTGHAPTYASTTKRVLGGIVPRTCHPEEVQAFALRRAADEGPMHLDLHSMRTPIVFAGWHSFLCTRGAKPKQPR